MVPAKGPYFCTVTSPVLVIASLLAESSTIAASLHVNKLVPATGISGVVLGVNAEVYTAVPFTTRRLEI